MREDRFQWHFPVLWDDNIGYFAHYFSVEIDDEVGKGRICIEFFNDELAMFKIWPEKNPMNIINHGGMVDIAYCFQRRALFTKKFAPQVQIVGKKYSEIPKTVSCHRCKKGRYNLKTETCSRCGRLR